MSNNSVNAVVVKDLRFTYLDIFGNPIKHALNDLSVCVPKGQIYALLGPNGSGKTTLIKCMVSRLKPSAGTISIFGSAPGSSKSQIPGVGVGYVPQELALFLEFTIEDSLTYFGKLYGLSKRHIESRIEFLLKFLRLPEKTRLLSDLSDGQRRRISMSIGLIHSPPLLILDEPTVGVDPLLRLAIWEHLENLSKNCSITIIITTHYIEEARGAARIGFIRDGHMVTEDSPQYLLKKHKTQLLEDVFLSICYNIDSNESNDKNNIKSNEKHLTNTSLENKKCEQMDDKDIKHEINLFDNNNVVDISDSYDKYKTVDRDGEQGSRIMNKNYTLYKHWALFFKNWIKLRGNLTLVFWVLLLPSVEISLFLMVTGPQHGLRVSVFNDEVSKNFSTQILHEFDSDFITQIPHRTLHSAIESVELGRTTAAVVFGHNYTESLLERLENKFLDETNDTNDRTDTIKLYVDMSNIMAGPQIVDKVRTALTSFLRTYFQSVDENPRVAEIPLIYEYIYGHFDPTFAEYALPGLMSFITFYAPLKLCTFSMLKEREEGILERSLVAGVNVADYLISHIILQLISLIIQIIVYCFTIFFIWELEVKGSAVLLVIELFFHGLCSVSFGVLISSLVDTESAAMVIRVGVLLPSFFFSGIIWPTESYSRFLQTLTLLSPLTLPTEAFRAIMSRGWDITYFPVWIAIVSNCLHSAIYLMIAVFAAKIKIIDP